MRNTKFAAVAVMIGFLGVSIPMFAHHGRATFDDSRLFTVKGTVSAFIFANPHVEVFLDVKDSKGNIGKWIVEATSPNILAREGWGKNTLKPGDEITATGHPARNGANAMRITKFVMPDGREITFDGPGN